MPVLGAHGWRWPPQTHGHGELEDQLSPQEVWWHRMPKDKPRWAEQELRGCRTSRIPRPCLNLGEKNENITGTVSDQKLRRRELTNKKRSFPSFTDSALILKSRCTALSVMKGFLKSNHNLFHCALSSFSFAKFSMKIQHGQLTFSHIQVSFKSSLSF